MANSIRLSGIAAAAALGAALIVTNRHVPAYEDFPVLDDGWARTPRHRSPKKRTVDPTKKAARKRQRKARAVTRKHR